MGGFKTACHNLSLERSRPGAAPFLLIWSVTTNIIGPPWLWEWRPKGSSDDPDSPSHCMQSRPATVQDHSILLHPKISECWTDSEAPTGPHNQWRGLLLFVNTPLPTPWSHSVQVVVQTRSPCAPIRLTSVGKCQLKNDIVRGHTAVEAHVNVLMIRGSGAEVWVDGTQRPCPAVVSQNVCARLSDKPRNLITGGAVVTQSGGLCGQQMKDWDTPYGISHCAAILFVQSRSSTPHNQATLWRLCSKRGSSTSCLLLTSPPATTHEPSGGDVNPFSSSFGVNQEEDCNFSWNQVPDPHCPSALKSAPACQQSPAWAHRPGSAQAGASAGLAGSASGCARESGIERLVTRTGTRSHVIQIETHGLGSMEQFGIKCQSGGNKDVTLSRIPCDRCSFLTPVSYTHLTLPTNREV